MRHALILDQLVFLSLSLHEQIAVFISKVNGAKLSDFFGYRKYCLESVKRYVAYYESVNNVTDRQKLVYRNYPNISGRR